MTDIIKRLREDAEDHLTTAHECDCSPYDTVNWKHATNAIEAAEEITRLRAELAAANLYRPCQRKDTPHVPVKAIGKCDFDFWRIIESDEEFAARAGVQIQDVTE